jgi:exopolysaccharide production protein ExoQ
MPPQLALYGCYLFVAVMLWRDVRKDPYSTGTLWLPTLWMMRCGSRSIDYWMGGGEGGRVDPVLIAIMIVLGLIALGKRSCQWGGILSHNSAIFIFYTYMVLSVVWAPDIEVSAIKILRPLGDLIMALVVLTEPEPRQAIITMCRRTAIVLIPISIVLIRYFPHLGKVESKHWGSDMWVGVATHKNPLGQLCLVSALAYFWSLHQARAAGQKLLKQRTSLLYLGFTFYLLLGGDENSRSSTSMLCLVMATGLFIWFGFMRNQIQTVIRRIMMGVGALLITALFLQLVGSSLQEVVAEIYGKDATLSDRTYLWADVMRIGMDSPFLGSGYGGFWVPSLYPKLSPLVDNGPMEAHNGYLETWAQLGLVGVALLAFVILQSIRSASRLMRDDFEYGRVRLALIFTVVVMNYSEATFPRGTHLWWYGFLVVALYADTWVYRAPAPSSLEFEPA